MAGDGNADTGRRDRPLRRLDAGHAAALYRKARDLAALHDVDAERARRARECPDHGIVPGDAAAPLHGRALDRETAVDVEHRLEFSKFRDSEHLGVDAVHADGVDRAAEDLHLMRAVREAHLAALAQHDVVVELAGEPLVEAQRAVEELRARQVVVV